MFLEIKDIYKSFGEKDSRVEVLKGVNLELEKGQFCVLLGPSGSGKSTLLNIIGGIDSADSGEIIVDGSSMKGMDDRSLTRYRREHLGYIFQMYNLIPNLTVRENIEVGAYLSKDHLDVDEINRDVFQKIGALSYGALPDTIEGLKAMRLADKGFTAWDTYDGEDGSIVFILETE